MPNGGTDPRGFPRREASLQDDRLSLLRQTLNQNTWTYMIMGNKIEYAKESITFYKKKRSTL